MKVGKFPCLNIRIFNMLRVFNHKITLSSNLCEVFYTSLIDCLSLKILRPVTQL